MSLLPNLSSVLPAVNMQPYNIHTTYNMQPYNIHCDTEWSQNVMHVTLCKFTEYADTNFSISNYLFCVNQLSKYVMVVSLDLELCLLLHLERNSSYTEPYAQF